MLFRDTHIEVSVQMFRLKPVQPRPVGHCPRDRHNPRIVIRHLGKMIRKNLTVGRLPQRLGFARLRIIRSQSVKLLLFGHGRFIAFALLRHHMKDHRKILNFQELKHLDQTANIMAIDWTVVGHPELFENHARKNHPLHMLLRPPSHLQSLGPAQLFNKVSRSLVQMHEPRIGSDPI